jgi:hypothetical protein
VIDLGTHNRVGGLTKKNADQNLGRRMQEAQAVRQRAMQVVPPAQ